MRRFAPFAAALMLPAGALAAEPAPPVDPAVVMAGVATCVAATATGPLDRAMIEAQGWALGKAFDASGAELPNTIEMRSRAGSSVLMTTPRGADLCIIISRVADEGAVATIRSRMLEAYPGVPQVSPEVGEAWASGNHLLGFARAGQPEAPSVRIVVKGKGAT